MANKDLYQILGVSKSASSSDIKRAYRKLSQQYHPDKFKSASPEKEKEAENKFKEINEAYEILSDDNRRKRYDQFGTTDGNARDGFDFGGFGGGFEGFGGFEDILNSMFGGSQRQQKRGPQPGTDLSLNLEFTLKELYFGTTKSFNYRRNVRCGTCSGHGSKDPNAKRTCHNCGGSGVENISAGFFSQQSTCRVCDGRGFLFTDTCRTCHGNGLVTKIEKFEHRFDKGLIPGNVIVFANKGNDGEPGAPTGKLHINILYKEEGLFKIDQNMNILLDVTVSLEDAIMGNTIEIPHFDRNIPYKIDNGLQSGDKKVFRGQGYPLTRHTTDLIVTFKIEIPQNLNTEQKGLFKTFSDSLGAKQKPLLRKFKDLIEKFCK